MSTITQPLRDEHKELFPHIESLRQAGDVVDLDVTQAAQESIDEAYRFLTHHLIPHAQAEDKALYPVVQQAMGAAQATATMVRDHVEVLSLTEELGELRTKVGRTPISNEQLQALRRVLYGLYTLVKVHFAKEEEIYLPLLDQQLTQEEARQMFAAMEAAAADARQWLPS